MFWSAETLAQRLPTLVNPFRSDRIDCAAYTLAVGSEVYVSPSDQSPDPDTVTIRRLDPGQTFAIPPGQFAFLITEEVVSVPPDVLALISIRARIKFRGLVNVSGFHVDPGYQGQLTFAVFNAGPVPVHLKRGQPIFLIWYANLDGVSSDRKDGSVSEGIDSALITGVAGKVQSFASLSDRIEKLDKNLSGKINAVEKQQEHYRAFALIAAGIIVAILAAPLKDIAISFFASLTSAPPVAASDAHHSAQSKKAVSQPRDGQ